MPDDLIGTRIRQLRLGSGLTQEQLAIKAGISVRALGYAEAGRFRPLPLHRKAIAAALGVTVDDLERAS